VGYLTVPWAEYVKDIGRPFFKVVGTGFLVRDSTVITNKHVIEGLQSIQRDLGFTDAQRLLYFVYPQAVGSWQTALAGILFWTYPGSKYPDIGLIEFQRPPNAEFEQCKPLHVGDFASLVVGHPVAAMGYAHGEQLLTKDQRVYRFGPVLQQGYVSAISPFDQAGKVDEILLDLRVAPGLSGSPVFWPGDGSVIGMIEASTPETAVAIAHPLSSTTIQQYLAAHEEALAAARTAAAPSSPPPS